MNTVLWLALVLLTSQAHSEAFFPFERVEHEQLFQKLTHELRCVVCKNQMLADSDVPLAMDLRRELFERVRMGETEHQIVQELINRYGEQISFSPPFSRKTWLLWCCPLALALYSAYYLGRFLQWS